MGLCRRDGVSQTVQEDKESLRHMRRARGGAVRVVGLQDSPERREPGRNRPGDPAEALHPPLPLVGVSIVMQRERQQSKPGHHCPAQQPPTPMV